MNHTDPPTRPSRSKAVLRAPWVLWVVLLILVLVVVAAVLLWAVTVTPAPAGYYTSPGWRRDYPRLQILTVEGLLAGAERLDRPPAAITFKQAQKDKPEQGTQQPGFEFE